MTSLSNQKLSVEAKINSDRKGLKLMLSVFFHGAKLFARIKHTDNNVTTVTIQGHRTQLDADLSTLRDLLVSYYQTDVEYGDYLPVDSANALVSIQIEETEADFKRMGSSGEFDEKEFDEMSFHTDTSEQVKKMGETIFQSIIKATSVIGRTTGLISSPKEKHITLKYQNETHNETHILEVSTILNLDLLMKAISKKFGNPIIPLKSIYLKQNDVAIEVTDVTDLMDKETYYVLNVNEQLPKKQEVVKFSTMEDFFDKLKSEQLLEDDEVKIIKDVFAYQKIKFMNLKKTTDEKLKEDGIKERGLRDAILAVTENL